MSGQKKQSKGSKYRFLPFHSASESNLADASPGGSASGQSDSGSQSSVQQGPQQATLSPPTPSRSRLFFHRLGFSSSQPPSPPPRVAPHNVSTVHHTAMSASPVAPSISPRPHSSQSEPSAQKIHGALTSGGNVTAVTTVPSVYCGTPSSSDVRVPSVAPVSAPPVSVPLVDVSPASAPPPVSASSVSASSVSASPASASPTSAPHQVGTPPVSASPASASPQVSAPQGSTSPASVLLVSAPEEIDAEAAQLPGASEPQPHSSVVWRKTLEIVEPRLSDNNLPPLDTTNLTSESANENIGAVIKSLNALQEDKQKKQWGYTWRGKKIVIAERLGEILRSIEPYTKIVDTVVQCDPQVGALVWGGIQAIIRVALNHAEAMEGFEVATAALLEKLSICEFYSEIYNGVLLPSQSSDNRLQLQAKLEYALPELYAAVIVFSVKARTYFEAKGIKKIASKLKSFDLEFQPFIDEVNAKEWVIRECADAATMERVRVIGGALQHITSELKPLAKLNDISTTATEILKVTERIQENTIDDRVYELLKTLSPLEPLKRHQDIKLPRAKDTGTWILRLESFCEWRDSNSTEKDGQVFCCYGIPGAGKSVICSIVIDDLCSPSNQQSNIGVACMYADYKDQNSQTLVHILGSLLHQFLTTAQQPIPDEVVKKLRDIRHQGKKVGTDDILALLKIRLQQFKRAFICIDAVDELEPKARRQLLDTLKGLKTNNTRLFLTGRGHVENEVRECFQVTQACTVIISASEQDIGAFVQQQIMDDPYPDAMDEVLEKDIVDAIFKKSQGMFLLPTLHIQIVLQMPTKYKRRGALDTLPTTPNESYRGIIARIRDCPNPSQAALGMQVLMWLHFAYRPLKLKELQHALAVEKGCTTEFHSDNIPPQKALLDACFGLVVLDDETMTVRFMHFTLEEYFQDNARTEFPDGCSSITETCLTYLNLDELKKHCTEYWRLRGNIKEYAFLNYASLYWGAYVKQNCSDGLKNLITALVEHESESPPCSIQALPFENTKLWMESLPTKFSGIHAIAYFGLSEHMANFSEVELEDDVGRTPLSLAAGEGHEAVVRLLIERYGVDIDAKDKWGKTPLIWAAYEGHEAVVRLLIERYGVDIDAKDKWGQTALIWATKSGHEAVVRLLIERDGVDIDGKGNDGKTPLIWAAGMGHEAVVRLLIERDGVDINTKDNEGNTPLMKATENAHEAVVRLLIERDGVDLNSRAHWYERTPLMCAAGGGHEAVVRLLIERDGVDIDAKDQSWQTALILAAESGHEAVVRLLIERDGVDINAKDCWGKTPLIRAAGMGHEAVVRLLIERDGVYINARDYQGKTPLIWATEGGHEAVVRLLIERGGVDIDGEDNGGKTPFIWAAERGREAVVRLLIERDGVDIDAKDRWGQTAFRLAAESGHEAVVRLLIERDGVDIDAKDHWGKTPLIQAAKYGYEAVVRLLIERDGVDINAKDVDGYTAFMLAAENGHEAVVRLLIERDAVDIDAKDNHGETALSLAVAKMLKWAGRIPPSWVNIEGTEAIVRLLQAQGSDQSR